MQGQVSEVCGTGAQLGLNLTRARFGLVAAPLRCIGSKERRSLNRAEKKLGTCTLGTLKVKLRKLSDVVNGETY